MLRSAQWCLIAGVLVLGLSILNASTAETITPSLERADVLAGMAGVGLMLVSILWTRASPRSRCRSPSKRARNRLLRSGLPDLLAAAVGDVAEAPRRVRGDREGGRSTVPFEAVRAQDGSLGPPCRWSTEAAPRRARRSARARGAAAACRGTGSRRTEVKSRERGKAPRRQKVTA